MFLKYAGGNAVAPSGAQKKRFIGALPATTADGLPTKSQVEEMIQEGITTDISDNNIAFTGNNTHSGTETFSNAAGVTTDIISERTAGAGTAIKTPIISAGAATLAPTAAQSGSTIALAKADGLTVTLPAASATNIGIKYKFVVSVSCTSVGYVINTTGTDVFLGAVLCTIAAGTNVGFFASTANKKITLDATTKGGLIGGWVEVECVSGTQWQVTGVTLGSGTVETPFSN